MDNWLPSRYLAFLACLVVCTLAVAGWHHGLDARGGTEPVNAAIHVGKGAGTHSFQLTKDGKISNEHDYGDASPTVLAQQLILKYPNIRMVFSGPGIGSKDPNTPIRLVDVLPTILTTMGIHYDPADLDGEAVKLPKP